MKIEERGDAMIGQLIHFSRKRSGWVSRRKEAIKIREGTGARNDVVYRS